MRHLIESASKLTEATQEQLNQMRQYIQTLTQALEMYPDMAADIEPRLQRLRAFVQGSQRQQPGEPGDPRGTTPTSDPAVDAQNDDAARQNAARNASANANQAAADAAMGDRSAPAAQTTVASKPDVPVGSLPAAQTQPEIPQNLRFATSQAAQRALGPQVARRRPSDGSPVAGHTTIMIGNEYFAVPMQESRETDMSKKIDEASININGADASEVAEILRMMQLAGAVGAKVVGADDINPGPKPCPICGKVHGPQPTPCGSSTPQGPKEPDMGDMIRMMSMDDIATEEAEDGGFGDATTEPDEYTTANAGDVSDMIPSGDDLHKEKGSYAATAGGDNPMNTESLKARLQKALAEKRK